MLSMCDLHTHSHFSIDSSASIESMCMGALSKSITCIAFSEHYDLNPNDEGYGFFKPEQFSRAIESARKQFSGQLTILKGVEFSEPHLYPKEFAALNDQEYDVIIGSIHMLQDQYVGAQEILSRYSIEELYEQYFHVMLEAVRFAGFDVLAHFDLPKRYWKQSMTISPVIEEILTALVRSDIALEINTSSLRRGTEESMPNREILKKYAELGGKMVTLGSDAHKPEDVGADFDYAQALLREFPQLEVGYFERRRFKSLEYLL